MEKGRLPEAYIQKLATRQEKKAQAAQNPKQRLLTNSGALLDWVGEWVNDPSVSWRLEHRSLDDLTLTGPWKIIREDAQKDPRKFRKLLENPAIRAQFSEATFDPLPILVREDDKGILRVLDGMNRVIAAIRDGIQEIDMYIGRREGTGTTQAPIEPHVIYDFLRAYEQGRGTKEGVEQALRFLLAAYGNTRELLHTRFNPDYTINEELRAIIAKLLAEKRV